MVRADIVGGLRNAMEKGYSLEMAMQSFINAGYNPQEIQEAVAYVQGTPLQPRQQPIQPTQRPQQNQNISNQNQGQYYQTSQMPRQVPPPTQPIQRAQAQPVSNYSNSQPSGKSSKLGLIVIIVLILLLLAGGAIVSFFLLRDQLSELFP